MAAGESATMRRAIMHAADLGEPDPRMRAILADYPYPATLFTVQLHRSCELADVYTLELVLGLLREWRIDDILDAPATAADTAARLGFVDGFLPAFEWLLGRAAAAGALASPPADGGPPLYAARGPLPPPRRDVLRAIGLEVDPSNAATLDLLDAAAATYPAVARGETDGETALLAPARAELWARYFDNRNPVYAVNNRVAAAAAAARLPSGRPARILEVGAGGGSGSGALLEAIGAMQGLDGVAEYQLSEPSPFFRRRAERALRAGWPALPLRATALDIDGDWSAQGAAAGTFDLVFGVNVLHVARHLLASLGGALDTLRAGGWLVIGECLRPRPGQPLWPEFVFKLLDGFNRVDTDPAWRPNAGFLTPEQWLDALGRAGFTELAVEPDVLRIREVYPGFLTGALCARRPL